jgi:hypothetical protein
MAQQLLINRRSDPADAAAGFGDGWTSLRASPLQRVQLVDGLVDTMLPVVACPARRSWMPLFPLLSTTPPPLVRRG